MKTDERAIERAERVAASLEAHPLTRELREREAAEILGKRKAAIAKIAELRIDLEACGVVQRDIDGMAARLSELEKERAELIQKIGNQKAFFYDEKARVETAISRQEAYLVESCDSAISVTEKHFRDTWEILLGKSVTEQQRHGEKNIFTETKPVSIFSNQQCITSALKYCRAAIDELERMKMEPEPNPERIEALKKGVLPGLLCIN